jgi:hypothetical protein
VESGEATQLPAHERSSSRRSPTMNMTERESDWEALQALAADAVSLDALERRLSEFNLFEAIGMVDQEIRHSTFLAFLLDPIGSHGLGDTFLKRILREVCAADSIATLDELDLSETQVAREWRNIDILVVNQTHRFAIAIENKVYAGEHSDQLNRYHEIVHEAYSGYSTVLVFLSLSGVKPSHDGYATISYSMISAILEEFVDSRRYPIRADVTTVMSHYIQMLRRRHLGDSDIGDLCTQIYARHSRAIELVVQKLPMQQMRLLDESVRLIEQTKGLAVCSTYRRSSARSSPLYTLFMPSARDGLVDLIPPDPPWSPSGRNLYFVFAFLPSSLDIVLQIRRGPLAAREQLRDIALRNRPLFTPGPLSPQYIELYRRIVITPNQFAKCSSEELICLLREWWEQFVSDELQKIESIFVTELSGAGNGSTEPLPDGN